jgi:tryptophan 2,3-dioxygenase
LGSAGLHIKHQEVLFVLVHAVLEIMFKENEFLLMQGI